MVKNKDRKAASGIELKQISMNLQGKQILKNVSLEIAEGEIFGLLGPSGAGKTTLMKVLTGQWKQSGGEAWVLEKDTRSFTNEDYVKFGMAMDNTGLYERLSCYDNLILFAKIFHLPPKRVHKVLEQMGLGDSVRKPAARLSKGMRQRLVLARAVLHEPRILFLDEPTTGLDPGTVQEIHALIQEQRENGTTIFLTTHNMEEASRLCDHVALLHQGSIVEYGAPDEICRRHNAQNHLELLLKDGNRLEMPNESSVASRLEQLFREENVMSIHSTEPNLETVFLELTGRGLE